MLKRIPLELCRVWGIFAALRVLQRDHSLLLAYHGVVPGDDQPDFLSGNFVAEAAFEQQMRWIARHYEPVSLRDVVDSLSQGRKMPRRAVTVTFDDGFANNYRFAFPILRKHRIPATVFLTTGCIGVSGAQLWTERVKRAIYLTPLTRLPDAVGSPAVADLATPAARERATRAVLNGLKRMPPAARNRRVETIERECGRPPLTPRDADRYDFLTWDQVRAMSAAGIEFGSHTVSHPILTTLSDEDLAFELRQSKETIETEVGSECYAFAYPNGSTADFGPREQQLLARLGYRAAFSLIGRPNPAAADRFALGRVNISRGYYRALFDARVTGALYLPERLRQELARMSERGGLARALGRQAR
jgi:peptidoglycan/xylan/chitin deacetylase (PgdA/CDA1 family)